MKNILILIAPLVIPVTSYSKPLRSLAPHNVSAVSSCLKIEGNWTGECQETDGDETRTYQSSYRVLQDGCHSIQLIEGDVGAETFIAGRTNMTQHSEWGTFFNVTSYARWSDSGTQFNVKENYSAEVSFEGQKRIASGNRDIQIKFLGAGNISFSQRESSSNSSITGESSSKGYSASIECSYKLTR